MTEPRVRTGFGLVMAGGAARGAYQAGVLRFLYRDLPKQLGWTPWPDIVSGTSVGSLNGVFAAARDPAGIDHLMALWQGLRIHDVYRFGAPEMLRFLKAPFQSDQPFALLDGTPLRRLVEREFPGPALRTAIDSGRTRAFIISATELATGRNALFIDAGPNAELVDPLPQVRVYRQRTLAHHLAASAAIPFLFQPVQVEGTWMVDGGLRMNTPLRPVLRSGANRALVVSLMQGPYRDYAVPDAVPNLFFLAGKTFNALLLDPVERDLHNAEKLNGVLRWGEERYGDGFAKAAGEELDLHAVETLFVRPSEDIGRMAAQIYRDHPPKVSPPVRYLLSRVRDDENATEADLLSYLFFDRVFTGALESLGYEDAKRAEEQIVALIGPEPQR
ncbi:MAG: patatin-like phospholipase family protein [Alphaproteobacteria bacterium]|nr:patatin-like phospholipase family protein [Alphaproteobacteria bacterium]